jgi:threonine dehydrogenase-like Zn-dependent dehydrogenase
MSFATEQTLQTGETVHPPWRRVQVVFSGPQTVGFLQEADRPLKRGEIRYRTLFSGISSGTELTMFRNTNPYLHKRWDKERRIFVQDPTHESIEYPVTAGYEEVGEVVEHGPGVRRPPLGSLVYGTWGHRTIHIGTAKYAREHLLPPNMDPLLGIFAQIGAIALNGVLDAAIRLGETVAVFGLGVVGQLVAQLARLSGAEVIGVDLIPLRLQLARQLGIGATIQAGDGGAAERIKRMTGGRGADVCIEASGAAPALHEAIRAAAYSSKVVALGFFQGSAAGLYLGEEFHHNRINLVCSQISGLAPDLQHRWNRVRLVQTFMQLVAQGKIQVQPLVTHVLPAAEAPRLFRLLDERPAEVVQAVIDFRPPIPASMVTDRPEPAAPGVWGS